MRKSTFYAILAVIIAAALVITVGVGSSWFTNSDIKTWFNSWGQAVEAPDNSDDKKPDDNKDKPSDDNLNDDKTSGTTYLDVMLTAYGKDGDGNYLDLTFAMPADEETNTVTFTQGKQKLAVPKVDGVTSDKYQIKYLKLNGDTDEFTEISEADYLKGDAGTYKFVLTFTDSKYAQKENSVKLVIEPQEVSET